MKRLILLVFIALSSTSIAIAADADSAPNMQAGTYILQVSSNLDCEAIEIEVSNQTGQVANVLKYKNNAYASIELLPGTYEFGDITCISGSNKLDSFQTALGNLSPIKIEVSKAYFGGQIIVKLNDVLEKNTPTMINNCPLVLSKARGEASHDCEDGTGVDTSKERIATVNIYTPPLANEELYRVRTALNKTEDQFTYLPLRTSL